MAAQLVYPRRMCGAARVGVRGSSIRAGCSVRRGWGCADGYAVALSAQDARCGADGSAVRDDKTGASLHRRRPKGLELWWCWWRCLRRCVAVVLRGSGCAAAAGGGCCATAAARVLLHGLCKARDLTKGLGGFKEIGPLFHKGWYHLFYQYNQESAVWGNITWGHAVSKDLIHWFHLPYAMVPDQWYDVNGVWTGSATILPDGQIIMLYTGDTTDGVQVQNLAYPANLSDPLLLNWEKSPSNPVLLPPPGIGPQDFRDPTTAWLSPGGDKWRITIGSKDANKTGISIVYETVDFVKYELLDGYLHAVPGTGMWECIDFYPVSLTEENGLDTSVNGPGVKHVMKASLDDDKNDYYALGTYDPIGNKWTPDDPVLDVGIGLRYDYGKYYASKTFYDHHKQRRILWGWIRETDAEELDLLKGWSSVQSVPRTVVYDKKTGTNILQWPVEEVESLRSEESVDADRVKLGPGSVVPVAVDSASQLDIEASFELDGAAVEAAEEGFECPTSGGAAARGVLGPFGIVVLADETLTELTPIYFYIAKGADGKAQAHFCVDELRSSVAPDVDKIVYGSSVPVLEHEKYRIRSLVDHSIVESFAQGGRRVITSRVYPTKATNGAARVLLFNNATGVSVTASVKIWKMASADIRPFPSA